MGSRSSKSIRKILSAARHLFGENGFKGASMQAVATAAGVSKGLVHYHFESKEHLLLETTRLTFQQIHHQFSARFDSGEQPIQTTLEAFDALYATLRQLQKMAPFVVETFAISAQGGPLQKELQTFLTDHEAMLAQGMERAFSGACHRLALSPAAIAGLVRLQMIGLITELALVTNSEQLARVDESYQALRGLFERIIMEES